MADEKKTEENLLVPKSVYLEAGVYIGTRFKMPGMKKFIFSTRKDGINILSIDEIDKRIRLAAKIIAQYKPQEILVTASRIYAVTPAEKFAEIIGCKIVKGRFIPGTLTDPNNKNFTEPKLIIVSNPRNERQAIKEAGLMNIPVIALCDTDDTAQFVDFIIPTNNKGRNSLALIYFLLTREVLKEKGVIKDDSEFKYKVEDFITKLQAEKESGIS
ncbi:MAG: 30S ribosomal protein S2 [Candidatus Micrarchaeales archaeon]